MKHNMIEWVSFLNTDNNHRFGLKKHGSNLSPRIKDYLPAEEFVKTYEGWANDEVARVWHNNWENEGKCYHLIEVIC